MKTKKILICMLMIFLLVGCQTTDLPFENISTGNIPRLDRVQEIKNARGKLPKQERETWTYRKENIQKVLQLIEDIKSVCDSKETIVETDYNKERANAGITELLKRAEDGMEPSEEEMTGLTISIQAKNKEALWENCKKLVLLGFTDLGNCSSGEFTSVQNGYQIFLHEEERIIIIEISDYMLYGPVGCVELFDKCFENGWFISEYYNYGGPLDGIVLCSKTGMVNAFLKEDKLVELVVIKENWEKGNFFTKEDEKGVAELLARMCEDKNEAISMVKELKRNGPQKGTLKECTWKIQKRNSQGDGTLRHVLIVKQNA